MSEKIEKVYGPATMPLARINFLRKIRLWFVPTIIHETADGTVVYKLHKGVMYVLAVVRKPTQFQRAGES